MIVRNVITTIHKIITVLKNKNLNRLKLLNILYISYEKSYNKMIQIRESLKKNELRKII